MPEKPKMPAPDQAPDTRMGAIGSMARISLSKVRLFKYNFALAVGDMLICSSTR
jgi:hypothetical protein